MRIHPLFTEGVQIIVLYSICVKLKRSITENEVNEFLITYIIMIFLKYFTDNVTLHLT